MASAVCQNQFLGSRISLVSKSEIRYEGILYALDLCETTISLAKVRSYGTEDRPTDRPIPPKDEVFEYIIFRGSDIKAIDVVETPKHAANSGMPGGIPADPAIVDFSHSGGNGFHYEGGRMRPNNSGGSASRGGPQGYAGGHGSNMRNRSYDYTNDAGVQVGRNMNRGMGGGGQGGRQQYGAQGGRNNYGGNTIFRQGGGGFNQNNGGQFQPRGRMTTPNRGGNYGQPQQQRRGGRPQGGGGNRTPLRARGMNQAAFPPKVSFDGDYDFEKANEELLTSLAKAKLEDSENAEKSDDETQNKEEQEQSKEQRIFYRKDNFFDSISCEALERSKGKVPRVDWKAERKLNAETFGLPHSPNGNGTRLNRQGWGQRMPRGGNMMNMSRGPGAGYWMVPNNFFRGGPRRPRMRNN